MISTEHNTCFSASLTLDRFRKYSLDGTVGSLYPTIEVHSVGAIHHIMRLQITMARKNRDVGAFGIARPQMVLWKALAPEEC
jgi:hypothetical protein